MDRGVGTGWIVNPVGDAFAVEPTNSVRKELAKTGKELAKTVPGTLFRYSLNVTFLKE
jgi:hypothetical protein